MKDTRSLQLLRMIRPGDKSKDLNLMLCLQFVFLVATLPALAVSIGAMIIMLTLAKRRQLLFI